MGKKTLILTLVLVTSAVWLQAQDSGQMSGKTAGLTTIQGCLKYTDSHYRLTDSTGKVYQLSNEANRLTHYVGQQVAVTGKPGVRSVDTTVQGSESSAKQEPVFKVSTVKKVADTCSSGGN